MGRGAGWGGIGVKNLGGQKMGRKEQRIDEAL